MPSEDNLVGVLVKDFRLQQFDDGSERIPLKHECSKNSFFEVDRLGRNFSMF